jgi:MFS family permease
MSVRAERGIRTFVYIWLGQLVSGIGSGLTSFALGIWVYQQTGSATQFTLIFFFSSIAGGASLPLAGTLADRWDRRSAMLFGNTGAALTTLLAAVLLSTGRLEIWHVYVGIMVRTVFGSLVGPAFSAATTQLVEKRHFGRASGMLQMTQASAQVVSPLLAGALMGAIGLRGIIFIDFATYLAALLSLLIVRIPRPEPAAGEAGAAADRSPVPRSAIYGWTYIRERRGLLALLIYFAAVNFVLGSTTVLFTPMILSFATAEVLGTILSISGVGFLCGSVLMSLWGGPSSRVAGVLIGGGLFGLCSVVIGLRPSAAIIAAGAFGMFLLLPVVNGCSQAIWQSKVLPEVQGRVFAVRRMIGASTVPLAYLLAGPLADHVFEPLVAGGAVGDRLRAIIGEGRGRGIGLMFITAGALTVLAQLAGYLYAPLREVEEELPDVVPDVALSGT